MTKQECQKFVVNSKLRVHLVFVNKTSVVPSKQYPISNFLVALSLAMNRDGSSGGVAYIVTIDEHGTEEKVVLGDDLPTFYDQ